MKDPSTTLTTEELTAGRLLPILNAPWWPDAAAAFDRALRRAGPGSRVLVLYGADVDGFSASYFVHRIIAKEAAEAGWQVTRRAIWNADYDFLWLPSYAEHVGADLILCFDIPVMRETEIVRACAGKHAVAIYDHHVIAAEKIAAVPEVTYVNSRVLDPEGANHPSSAFAAALAVHRLQSIASAELLVLAAGLIGDRADRRHAELFDLLSRDFSNVLHPPQNDAPLAKFSRALDAMFLARYGETPEAAEVDLAELLEGCEAGSALDAFSARYRLSEAEDAIRTDVSRVLAELGTRPANGLLCEMVEMETISVGKVASALARKEIADVVTVGMVVGDRAQFELRTPDANGTDLTELLDEQRRHLEPLSSGGHPNAAGALVEAGEAERFMHTLAEAWNQLEGSPPQADNRQDGTR